MSGENRPIKDIETTIAAALLTAFLLTFWWAFYSMGYSSGRNEERARIEREHYASEATQRLSNDCVKLSGTALAECAYKIAKTEREAERQESDLAAQWKAADWALFAAIIGGAQLVATAIGLIFIKRTLDATREAVEDTAVATDAMRKANEIAREDTRPILAFVGIAWEIFQGPDSQFARFIWRNMGGRPTRLLRLEIGREALPAGSTPEFPALLENFEVRQRDTAGLIIMP